jgi:hypothetical protein
VAEPPAARAPARERASRGSPFPDGAMAAGCLDDSTAARKTLLNAVHPIRSGG